MSHMSVDEDDLIKCLSEILIDNSTTNEDAEVDEDLVVYMAGMLSELSIDELMETGNNDGEEAKGNMDDDDTDMVAHLSNPVFDAISPFLESVGCDSSKIQATCEAVNKLARSKNKNSTSSSHSYESGKRNSDDDTRKLKGAISMSTHLDQQNTDEEDANRFLWGTDNRVSAMTNKQQDMHKDTTSSKTRRKQRQDLEKARKEYDAKMKMLKEEETKDTSAGSAVSIMVLPDYTCGDKREKDIQVRNVSLSLDNGRSLLDNAELKISYQRRYGLVGKNGVGKTTLLKAIASMSIEGFPKHHRVLHVRQEMHTTSSSKEISVLDAVLQADIERMSLLKKEKELLQRLEGFEPQGESKENDSNEESMSLKRAKLHERLKNSTADAQNDSNQQFTQDLKELDETYARLGVIGGDGAESRASMILAGLQFTHSMQTNPVSALSGGWKMRVSLAAALFIEPDLLLLDEPTNHLDLEAVLWLESYLVQYKHTCIVVSHDRGFLNEVCTDVIEFKDRELNYYKGDYDTYVKTSEENVRNTMRVYQAYQDKRTHMMEFITKFRFNAKRAALVQSRIKAVEKMDLEAPPIVEIEQLWRFSIPNPEPLGRPIISIDDVSFDYSHNDEKDGTNTIKKQEKDFLLQKVNFGVDLDSRIGILGANGAGKSTLLNLIMGKIEALKGSVTRNGRLRIAYFTQHSADKFNLEQSAVENMLTMFENEKVLDQEMRSFLGKFQIQGTDALKPMMMLSGGQKSRVAFACLSFQKPHVIVMDEPTNHLDMESIDALVEAIQDFKGGLMVVSHDQYFITKTCGELWVVGDGKATRFRGDFEEYKKYTLAKTSKRVAESVKSLSSLNN